ncbi:hypothetical protein DFH06DRAFT_98413 [Mycena polygramma]|nr:hypothetical protein DFH06DRAFT_98413 [Mycena polygramma]
MEHPSFGTLTLPGELIDSIIDWTRRDLAYSASSLASYALVSRQWVPRSRYHHFCSISLTRDRSKDTVKTFLSLVASPLVTFISSIRDVQLYHRSSYGTPVLSAGDIVVLLSRNGIHPTHLALDCHFNQVGIRESHRNGFASLTHLQLSFYGEVPLGRLFSYLSRFPSLKSLSLGIRNFGSELGWMSVEHQQNAAELPSHLYQLDIHQPDILRCLSSFDNPAHFNGLILRRISHFPDVTRYLRTSANSVALVSLTLDHCIPNNQLDLSRLEALRHLHIMQHHMWAATVLLEVLGSIAEASSPRPLEAIEIELDGREFRVDEDMEMPPWSTLDAVLAGPEANLRWPSLRRLTVYLPLDVPNASCALRQHMPLCDGQRILTII